MGSSLGGYLRSEFWMNTHMYTSIYTRAYPRIYETPGPLVDTFFFQDNSDNCNYRGQVTGSDQTGVIFDNSK